MRARKVKPTPAPVPEPDVPRGMETVDGYPVSYYLYAKTLHVMRRRRGESEGPIPSGRTNVG